MDIGDNNVKDLADSGNGSNEAGITNGHLICDLRKSSSKEFKARFRQ